MVVFFFFQAEDGIRDHCVTGVQTCALPISVPITQAARSARPPTASSTDGLSKWHLRAPRSEERRVGKECRSRRSPNHKKKNQDKVRYTRVYMLAGSARASSDWTAGITCR